MEVKKKKTLPKAAKVKVIFVFLFFVLLYGIIFVRFYLLQVKKQDFFKNLGKQQYSVELTVTPPRAQIFDRTGKIHLALNKKVKSAFIMPHRLTEKDKTLSFLKKHYPKTYKKIRKNTKKYFVWVDRRISKKKQEEIIKAGIKDIQFIKETQRFYPFQNIAPLLGFTNIDNMGISGLELKYNKQLAGTPSIIQIEKDARANKYYFTKEVQQKGTNGKPLCLTIDNKLQFLASDELKKSIEKHEAKEGAAIIMDPQTGGILAMANYPGFNPNAESINNLEDTKNKTVTECYEFGSVFKAFTALAALEEGVTTTSEEIDCEGKVTYIDKFRVENWKSTGIVSFFDVIKKSSNVGVAKIAKRLDTKLYDHLMKLGFSKPTNLGFPGERNGFVNPPQNWSRSSLFVLSFGYEANGTLMQLAKAFSIIANGGYDIQPIIVMNQEQKEQIEQRLYSQDAIDQTKEILESIGKMYKIDGYRIMGKTGTARIAEKGGYSTKRHVYTFAGIVEKDDYKRVIITFIKEPRHANIWASQLTGPLFQRIAQKMILHEELGLA